MTKGLGSVDRWEERSNPAPEDELTAAYLAALGSLMPTSFA